MKNRTFLFFLLTLVSFLSCDPPVPRPERRPFCVAEPQMPTWQLDLHNPIKLTANCDSVQSILYVFEIDNTDMHIPDGLGGEWTLVTYQDTTILRRQYRTTFFYQRYEIPELIKVTDLITTHLCTSQLDVVVKEGH